MFDYLLSGWSFFFRWPVANAKAFRPLGVFLGPLLQSFVFLAFSLVGFYVLSDAQRSWAPAFGFLGLSMLTGFFHEDGLADTADSLGVSKFDSHSSLEKIHSTFKDPRLGTFGVSALVLLWGFRLVAVAQAQLSILVLALVIVLSRTTSLAFGLYYSTFSPLAKTARSSHVMQMVKPVYAASVLAAGLGLALMSLFAMSELSPLDSVHFALRFFDVMTPAFFVCVAFMILASMVVFGRLVRRTEALNGDLLGALVCLAEVFITVSILRIF